MNPGKTKIQYKSSVTSRQIAFTAMFAALILIATYVFKIPTPTLGYIHIGDVFVLLAGIFLGPGLGGLAAGIGSALSDLFSGYTVWVPGTFFIKYLMSVVCFFLYQFLQKRFRKSKLAISIPSLIFAGIAGEVVMIVGYFFYKILVIVLTNGSFTGAGLASAITLSLAGVPFNIAEGVVSIALAVVLAPVFSKLRKNTDIAGQ